MRGVGEVAGEGVVLGVGEGDLEGEGDLGGNGGGGGGGGAGDRGALGVRGEGVVVVVRGLWRGGGGRMLWVDSKGCQVRETAGSWRARPLCSH